MADNSSIINALKGIDPADAMPFGAAATPEGSPNALSAMLSGLMGMPKRLLGNSANALSTGTYNPAPPMEAAMTLAGVGAPAAEAGAAGIFGGKLAKTADVPALIEANDMFKGSKPMSQIYGDTGWFKTPTDMKWKFEIPDEYSKVNSHGLDYTKDGSFVKGPTRIMFDHPELFEAYPQLKNTTMYNTVHHNPSNGVGRGSFDPQTGTAELEAPDIRRATSVGLHELQHGVQTLESFAPGGNPSRMAYIKEKAPAKLPMFEQRSHPDDLYNRLAGEVESRNVQTRMDYDPLHRKLVSPWETQDTRYGDQLVYNPQTDLIRALRNSK